MICEIATALAAWTILLVGVVTLLHWLLKGLK